MPIPDIDGFVNDSQRYVAERLQRDAQDLLHRIQPFGLVLTIEQVNQQPPAMGNHLTVVAIRPDIWSIRKAYEQAMAAPKPVISVSAIPDFPSHDMGASVVMMTMSPDCAGHTRPLAAGTMQRIAAGVKKFGAHFGQKTDAA